MTMLNAFARRPDLIDQYTRQSHALAIALHRHLGWPFYVVTGTQEQGEPCAYLYGLSDDRLAWDAQGARPAKEAGAHAQNVLRMKVNSTQQFSSEVEMADFLRKNAIDIRYNVKLIDQAWRDAPLLLGVEILDEARLAPRPRHPKGVRARSPRKLIHA